jgi:phosphoglycerate dehydrogenase-like enzyme
VSTTRSERGSENLSAPTRSHNSRPESRGPPRYPVAAGTARGAAFALGVSNAACRQWLSVMGLRTIKVLTIQRISAAERGQIEAVDPAIRLTDAGGWFDGEIRETWPAFTVARYLAPNAGGTGTRAERDRLLAEAEVILGGWPFPLDLRARAPRLKWFHQRPAGASNLLLGDLWNSDVVVTTSRGAGNTLAMAEYAVAGILHFAKGLHRAAVDRDQGVFDHRAYRPMLLDGKIACVVGVGGIGREVGRLCAALGMRVLGTRRHPQNDTGLPPGFSELGGAGDLNRFLPQSDAVVICCQWTPETTRLFDTHRFAAMKAGSILVNVARGEIVDEEALAEALQRGHLRGAVLDVYAGEFERMPTAALWGDPRVLITPHISAASDQDRHRAIDLFCSNLRGYLDGTSLHNVIDWQQGY